MSIKAMIHVWENSKHEGTELLTELALADWANDDGVCWPNLTRLAQRARVKKRQAINIIHKLEAEGTLHVQRGKGRVSSRYMLIMGRDAAELIPVLMEYYRLDKVAAAALATKLTEVQSSTPLAEGCNPVHLRGAVDYTSEVQSSVKQQAESQDAVPVRESDPSIDPSIDPTVSATAVADAQEPTIEQRIVAATQYLPVTLTVGKARNLVSDVIAHGGYGMKVGDKFTSVTANGVIADQFGDKPTATQIVVLARELHEMYAWWTNGAHGLSNPTKKPSVISALNQYREFLASQKPKAAVPAASRVEMIEWVETHDGAIRPKAWNEFASDFKRSFMAPAPVEVSRG